MIEIMLLALSIFGILALTYIKSNLDNKFYNMILTDRNGHSNSDSTVLEASGYFVLHVLVLILAVCILGREPVGTGHFVILSIYLSANTAALWLAHLYHMRQTK